MKGFSLLELLVVMTLIAITAFIVFPSQKDLVTQTRNDILKNQLLTAIHYAQQQAQSHGEIVTLCAREDNQTCGEDWNNGELIFIDKQGKGKIASSADVLYIIQDRNIKGNLQFRSALGLKYLSFNSTEDTTNNSTFSFYKSDQRKPAWKIILSDSGRARVES